MVTNNGNGDNTAPSQSNTAVPGDNSALPANSNPTNATEPRRVPLVTVTFVNHPTGTSVTGPSAATLARGHALPTVSASVPSLAKFCTVTPHVALAPAPPARRVALVNKPAISHVVRKTLRKYADVYAEKPNRPVVVANNNVAVLNSGPIHNAPINTAHGSLPVPQTQHAATAAPFNGTQAINVNVQHQGKSQLVRSPCLEPATDRLEAPVPASQPQNRISYYAYNYHNKVKPRDKLSPSHIPVSRLQIGAWSRQSQFVGDTMCKFLYNKKELVWEMLHSGGLKYKILIHYADVIGFDFDIPNSVFAKHKAREVQGKDGDESHAGNVSRLIVELSKAPEFFVEINPQPGKNTQWTRTTDFTDGEASACRYHVLEFNRGHLPHHYQKLLSSDVRLKLIVEVRQ
jgi:hypothetical protein